VSARTTCPTRVLRTVVLPRTVNIALSHDVDVTSLPPGENGTALTNPEALWRLNVRSAAPFGGARTLTEFHQEMQRHQHLDTLEECDPLSLLYDRYCILIQPCPP